MCANDTVQRRDCRCRRRRRPHRHRRSCICAHVLVRFWWWNERQRQFADSIHLLFVFVRLDRLYVSVSVCESIEIVLVYSIL